MGNSTISMAIFNCYVSSPEGTLEKNRPPLIIHQSGSLSTFFRSIDRHIDLYRAMDFGLSGLRTLRARTVGCCGLSSCGPQMMGPWLPWQWLRFLSVTSCHFCPRKKSWEHRDAGNVWKHVKHLNLVTIFCDKDMTTIRFMPEWTYQQLSSVSPCRVSHRWST